MQSMNLVNLSNVIQLDELPRSIYEINENFSNIEIKKNNNIIILNGIKNNLKININLGRIIVNGIENEIYIDSDITGYIELTGYRNKLIVKNTFDISDNSFLMEQNDFCVICLNKYHIADSNIHIMRCNHILHNNCFQEYSRYYDKCPMCKEKIK